MNMVTGKFLCYTDYTFCLEMKKNQKKDDMERNTKAYEPILGFIKCTATCGGTSKY